MANQQWQSERYAAHIPVPVTVMPGGSGRQSVSSIESANRFESANLVILG